jgi:hypothetical protein
VNSTGHSTTTSRELDAALAAEDTPSRSIFYGPFQDYHRRQRPGNHYVGLPARLATDARQPHAGLSAAFLPTKPRHTAPAVQAATQIAEPTEYEPASSKPPADHAHQRPGYIERPSLPCCPRACRSLHRRSATTSSGPVFVHSSLCPGHSSAERYELLQ